MIRSAARNPTFVHVLFFVASIITVAYGQFLYRVALVVILVAIRVWWIQATVRRTATEAVEIYRAPHDED